jgi:hypothetical protein
MIPAVDEACHLAFVHNPSFRGEAATNIHTDFIVMPMWTAAFTVMMQQTVTARNPDGPIGTYLECQHIRCSISALVRFSG